MNPAKIPIGLWPIISSAYVSARLLRAKPVECTQAGMTKQLIKFLAHGLEAAQIDVKREPSLIQVEAELRELLFEFEEEMG